MSLFKRDFFGITGAQDLLPPRPNASRTVGVVNVNSDTAMRHSAVWACLRLRGDLVSTMPVDVYRKVKDGDQEIQIEMPKPPVLVTPGGERVDMCEWMYSSEVDLDRAGNAVGLITERNSANLPQRIDLQALNDWTARIKSGEIESFRIGGKVYPPEQVWHEKQFTVAGLPVGLSPVAYAAWSIGQYQSAQQFALNWFGTGGAPKGQLKNSEQVVDEDDATVIKTRFKSAIMDNDVFVTGRDWEYSPFQAEAASSDWLEAQKFGIGDIARFFGCPGDLIDAAVSSGNITYANITQRNLQFLIMHLGPAVYRREKALSKLLPAPRYVKLNTSALLRMDDETRAKVIGLRLQSRTLAPSEARELYDQAPLTEEQIAEFDRLFGPPKAQPATTGNPVPSGAN